MGKLKVIWSNKAKTQLKVIHDYIKYKKKSPQGATNVKNDILKASREIVYQTQYQKDEIQPEYRRIIVRHYKLLYKEKGDMILILRLFDTYQSIERQAKDDY